MPNKTWVVGEEVLAADFNTYLQNQVVTQFPTTAARDAWASPPNGALCITTDTYTTWIRMAGAWQPYPRTVICTSTTRPTSPYEGLTIYETDTDKVYIHNGAVWVEVSALGAGDSYVPVWSSSGAAPAIGNGTLAGSYRRRGRWIDLRMQILWGSTTSGGTGAWMLSLPAAARSDFEQDLPLKAFAGTSNWQGFAIITAGATTATLTSSTSATDPRLASIGGTNPAAWTNGNLLIVQGAYEAAS